MAAYALMLGSTRWLFVLLFVVAVLASGVAPAHVHDASAPGLQNAQCPYDDATPRSVGVVPAVPHSAPLALVPAEAPPATEAPATQTAAPAASPRAPPEA